MGDDRVAQRARTTKRFPSRCASAIQIVRPQESAGCKQFPRSQSEATVRSTAPLTARRRQDPRFQRAACCWGPMKAGDLYFLRRALEGRAWGNARPSNHRLLHLHERHNACRERRYSRVSAGHPRRIEQALKVNHRYPFRCSAKIIARICPEVRH